MGERLTKRSLAAELSAQFNLERGLLRTFVDLIVRPETMLHGYIDGSCRPRYSGIVAYFILAVAISVALANLTGFEDQFVMDLRSAPGTLEDAGISDQKLWAFEDIVYRNAYLIYYAFLPICALVTFLIFRFWQFNFVEHLVVNAFLISQVTFLTLPLEFLFIPLTYEVAFNIVGGLGFGINAIYLIWAYARISRRYGKTTHFGNVLRSTAAVAVQLLGLIALSIAISVSSIWVLVYWMAL